MDPYADPPRLVFKSHEAQREEFRRRNTERFEKYFTAVVEVQSLFSIIPALAHTNFETPFITAAD